MSLPIDPHISGVPLESGQQPGAVSDTKLHPATSKFLSAIDSNTDLINAVDRYDKSCSQTRVALTVGLLFFGVGAVAAIPFAVVQSREYGKLEDIYNSLSDEARQQLSLEDVISHVREMHQAQHAVKCYQDALQQYQGACQRGNPHEIAEAARRVQLAKDKLPKGQV